MKDARQGGASIVFLIYYAFTVGYLLYLMSTRRPKRYLISSIIFALIRFGANIASLGWAIHLYDNFDWLIASLILGAEDPSRLLADDVSHLVRQLTTGYFALIISILFCIVGYEMEYIGKSVFYPKRPEGRNKFLHRLTHVAFWFENSLIPANVLLVVGASMISGALSKATPQELLNPSSIPKVKTGQNLRIAGQSLFLVAIIVGFGMLGYIVRKAGHLGKDRTALWWLAASAPFLLVRGIYGVLSAADWKYSYYIPDNYGANGLKTAELIAEYLMAVTMEAIAIFCIIRAIVLITVKKHAFVPYDERDNIVDETGRRDSEAVQMKPRRPDWDA